MQVSKFQKGREVYVNHNVIFKWRWGIDTPHRFQLTNKQIYYGKETLE